MADALCGPSNALSTFQKHTSVDRTLQQDRLVSQRLPEQGFRSSPGPNAGILDAEFEAFQAGPPSQLHGGQLQSGLPAVWPGQGFQAPQQQLSGWASDFQNMNLKDFQSSQAPSLQPYRFALPQPNASSAAWHQEFLREPVLDQPESRTQAPHQAYLGGANSYSMSQYQSSLATLQNPMQESALDQFHNQPAPQELDDAIFEKHFAAAALEAEQAMGQAESQIKPMSAETAATTQQNPGFDTASLLGPSIQRDMPSEPIIDADIQEPIGSDRISNEKGKGKEKDSPDDGDELARTAGTLLENVKHDQSQKFKQSSFLSLMRQLRDREVKVEGDKLVNVAQPLHPGGDFYPAQHHEDRHPGQPVSESEGTAGMSMWEQWSTQEF